MVSFHDFETLGLEDVLSEPGIVIVEWSEKFALRTDWPIVRIQLEHVAEDGRRKTRDESGICQKMKATKRSAMIWKPAST